MNPSRDPSPSPSPSPNPSQVRLVPEPGKAACTQQEEEAELQAVRAALSAEGRAKLVEATSALRAAQAAPDDPQALA